MQVHQGDHDGSVYRCSRDTAGLEPWNTALEQAKNIRLLVPLPHSISDMLSHPAAVVVAPAVCRPALNSEDRSESGFASTSINNEFPLESVENGRIKCYVWLL